MRQRLVLASALMAILLLGVSGTVEATPLDSPMDSKWDQADTDSQAGRLQLYRRGTPVLTVTYANCLAGRILRVNSTVDRFNNLPPDGCEVVLRNKSGSTFELCIGSGSIPPAFQQPFLVEIRSGDSPRCI